MLRGEVEMVEVEDVGDLEILRMWCLFVEACLLEKVVQ